ncbi:hypothetical protein IPM62_01760 [Candidatus Woesebacteria bacterium]|nr:MAG: hypothetical protein IPM62_01760 [Candidatus Woesebacteria bacterium]
MDEFIQNLKTQDEVLMLEGEIDVLIASLFKAPGFEEALKNSVRESTARFVEKLAQNKDKEKLLKDIKLRLTKVESIELGLALEPNEKTLTRLKNWININIGTNIVMDIKVNSDLVAGATVSYNGNYGDFTLAQSFKTKFENKKTDLIKLLNYK